MGRIIILHLLYYMLRHTARVRKVVYFLAFLSMGLGIGTLLLSYGYLTYQRYQNKRACIAWLEETAMDLKLDAIVLEVTEPSDCEQVFSLSQQAPDQIRLCPCQGDTSDFPALQEGDSLHKPNGTLYIEVYRGGTSPSGRFRYPCCK